MLGPMDFDDFMTRHELRDPQALLDEIAAAVPLTEGRVLLALVHQPSRGQKLLALDELTPLPVDIDEGHGGRSDLLYDRVWRLPIPPRSDTSASILVTVIVRSGTNGWGEEEIRWAMGWRYSNHNSDAFDRDLIVVTPHGWCSLWSESGGHTPAMVPS
jgi:hypothetical protein